MDDGRGPSLTLAPKGRWLRNLGLTPLICPWKDILGELDVLKSGVIRMPEFTTRLQDPRYQDFKHWFTRNVTSLSGYKQENGGTVAASELRGALEKFDLEKRRRAAVISEFPDDDMPVDEWE